MVELGGLAVKVLLKLTTEEPVVGLDGYPQVLPVREALGQSDGDHTEAGVQDQVAKNAPLT